MLYRITGFGERPARAVRGAINDDLHLLCGASTFITAAPDIGKLWAENMLGTYVTNGTNGVPMTVERAWYEAGKKAYVKETDYSNLVIVLRVAGWPDAFDDKLSDVDENWGTGDGLDIIKTDEQVHPL